MQQLLHCNNQEKAMSTKDVANTYNELTNKSVERINALGELNLKLAETMASRQMEVMNMLMDQGVRMMNLVSEAKGYNDLYKGQVDMAKEIAERMMEESKANVKLVNEMREGYRSWMDTAVAEAKDGGNAVRNAVTS
ncbi:MAG: hypothetical protein N838_05715 [Thiohalocapsa sp. PB-PSB1]|nr:MAG: hypothetical protein N838_05715 [Thiohalocapsa sp. PB-PSB1]